MGKVGVGLTMSLDGFIAGPNDDVSLLFRWYSEGDTEFVFPDGEMKVKVPAPSAELLRDVCESTGALVTGRRTFDITNGWRGKHPLNVPVFVVTHEAPQGWDFPDAPFTFVTDGVESAIAQAQKVAGDKSVAVDAASLTQQCLKAGLLDEIHVELAPVLLGGGVRLFEHLGTEPIELERTRVIVAEGITHITFRVLKKDRAR